MPAKTRVLTFNLFVATLVAILTSSWAMLQWPNRSTWVLVGLSAFVVLLILVTVIATRRMT